MRYLAMISTAQFDRYAAAAADELAQLLLGMQAGLFESACRGDLAGFIAAADTVANPAAGGSARGRWAIQACRTQPGIQPSYAVEAYGADGVGVECGWSESSRIVRATLPDWYGTPEGIRERAGEILAQHGLVVIGANAYDDENLEDAD